MKLRHTRSIEPLQAGISVVDDSSPTTILVSKEATDALQEALNSDITHAIKQAAKKTTEALERAEKQREQFEIEKAKERTKEAMQRAEQQRIVFNITGETSANCVGVGDEEKYLAISKACEAQGELILRDTIVDFQERSPNGTFEEFLEEMWPQDFKVYVARRENDPAYTRSYEKWKQKFDAEVVEQERIKAARLAQQKTQEALQRAEE